MSRSVDLIDALKRALRAQGMTYRTLAQRLDLIEAAIKRMFSRRAMTLVRMESICEVLGIGLQVDRAHFALWQPAHLAA